MDHRPLEGFVYAITPFNFTAIAGNLPTAPALMGNVVVWKPSPTQTHSAVLLMQLLEEAGLPKGVINLVTGDGIAVSEVALNHRDLAGIHFTGSTPTFQHLWKTVGNNIANYRTYPRLVGETGGKDFVVAHPSADRAVLKTALTRGSFEFQGQKCSASSRAYVPASIWNSGFKEEFAAEIDSITMGDVTDLSNFIGAVIDERAFAKNKAAIDRAKADSSCTVVAGGTYDDSVGYFVRPTVIECADPANEVFTTEYFGPILAVHVYEDDKYDEMLEQMESVSDYALTGSVISGDRAAAAYTMEKLRYAAGNFYINDKSTGAVVGQQPFGGGRASGTNDKAGAPQNLQRWTLTRAIKETLVPPTDYTYPTRADALRGAAHPHPATDPAPDRLPQPVGGGFHFRPSVREASVQEPLHHRVARPGRPPVEVQHLPVVRGEDGADLGLRPTPVRTDAPVGRAPQLVERMSAEEFRRLPYLRGLESHRRRLDPGRVLVDVSAEDREFAPAVAGRCGEAQLVHLGEILGDAQIRLQAVELVVGVGEDRRHSGEVLRQPGGRHGPCLHAEAHRRPFLPGRCPRAPCS